MVCLLDNLYLTHIILSLTGSGLSDYLEKMVSNQLVRVSDWLNANKLTLNAKKSNFVIFCPHQRKMDHSVNIPIIVDNSNHIFTSLECKDHVKYLGVLLDSHLS